MTLRERLFIASQYLVPQHLLSRAAGWLADTRIGWIKNPLIRAFVSHFQVDMSEAENPDPCSYPSFNEFFTRSLQPGARPICDDANVIVSPADGVVSQLGSLAGENILQAKNHNYSLRELLAGDGELCQQFRDGSFAVIYLSPRDYHRVHMPLAGGLDRMTHVPGELFSVNQCTTEQVPRLFARNERVICVFETAAGPMVLILVGAMIVASIETVWAGQVTPHRRRVQTTHYRQLQKPDGQSQKFTYATGEEMGRFKLGSTVIALFPKQAISWNENLQAGGAVRMGESMGSLKPTRQPSVSASQEAK